MKYQSVLGVVRSMLGAALLASPLLVHMPAQAQQMMGANLSGVTSLNQLLEHTRTVRERELEEHREREQRFLDDVEQRETLLSDAQSRLSAAKTRSTELQKTFEDNETLLSEMQSDLETQVGTLGEMFGVVRQVAGDTASLFQDSLISSHYPDRTAFTQDLSQSRELPSIALLERLWFEMQREMTATGVVTKLTSPVIKPNGQEVEQEVVHIGPFTAMSDGKYLAYLPESRKFTELSRQPAGRYLGPASALPQTASDTYTSAVIDPTRGSLLSVLVQAPTVTETIQFGGLVGYVIITLTTIGFMLAMYRLLQLMVISRAVGKQQGQIDKPLETNPLGRVLRAYHDHPEADNETLQLHLDEAIMKEIPRLETGLSAIKILAAVGPLLGLLGTVIGMIVTFQQITLFGTGDPKLMANGISQALITTEMGLIMAIPLLLLHSFLASRSRGLVNLLEEETAGIIAAQAERKSIERIKKKNAASVGQL